MASKILTDGGNLSKSHHSTPDATKPPYRRQRSSRNAANNRLAEYSPEAHASNVPAYSSVSIPFVVAFRKGNSNHTPPHHIPMATSSSSHPMPARTASSRNRLTGSERVNSVDPCRPLLA